MRGSYLQFSSYSYSMLRLFARCIFFYSLLLPTNAFSQWARSVGGSSNDYGRNIAVDASGNVYVTGDFYLGVDFDPGSGTTNLSAADAQNVFFAKYNSSGELVWAKSVGGSSSATGRSIAVDGSENVYVTGYFYETTVDFDPGSGTTNLTPAGRDDVFFAKYNSSGELVWTTEAGRAGTECRYRSGSDE